MTRREGWDPQVDEPAGGDPDDGAPVTPAPEGRARPAPSSAANAQPWTAPEGGVGTIAVAVEDGVELSAGRIGGGPIDAGSTRAGSAGVAVARGNARPIRTDIRPSVDDDVVASLGVGGPGWVIDGAFDLLRRRFVLLIAFAAALFLPIQLLELVVSASRGLDTTDSGIRFAVAGSGASSIGYALSFLRAIALSLLGIAVGRLVGDGLDGRRSSGRALSTHVLRRCWVAPLIVVMSSLVRSPAACFFGVGYFFADALVFTTSIAAGAERLGPWRALRRSAALGRGAFGLALVVSFGGFVITQVINAALLVGPIVLAAYLTSGDSTLVVVVQQLGQLALVVIQPLTAAIAACAYLEMRCRVEGLDLERRQVARGL